MAYQHFDMTVVTTQVQRSGPTVVSAGNRDWSSGMCDICDDCGICACVFFFGHCYTCYLSSKLGENCCAPVVAGTVPLRLKVRMMLGIRGSICEDCCCLFWCNPCITCQMAREMKAAGWPL